MPFSRNLTDEVIEKIAFELWPVLKDGSRLPENGGAISADFCMDEKHEKRKLGAKCADHWMEENFDPDYLAHLRDELTFLNDDGSFVVDLKTYNKLRNKYWLRAYNHGPAGGRYSADGWGGYMTVLNHGFTFFAKYLSQHDCCAAGASETRI